MSAQQRKLTGCFLPRGKIALIHVARRELSMADEDYRALLLRVAGVEHANDLTPSGFEAVMEEFKRLGFRHRPSQRRPKGAGRGSAPNRPTPAQWRLMEDRARQVGFGGLDDPRFVAWAKPRGKAEHPRFLDMTSAQRVIAALGNWIERMGGKQNAAAHKD